MQSELLKPCSPVSADAKLPIYIIRLELAHVATAINNLVSVIKTQPLGWPKRLTQRVLIWWYVTICNEAKLNIQVFSGDQLNGQKTSYDARSVLAKFASPVIDRQIPWAAVFGELLRNS